MLVIFASVFDGGTAVVDAGTDPELSTIFVVLGSVVVVLCTGFNFDISAILICGSSWVLWGEILVMLIAGTDIIEGSGFDFMGVVFFSSTLFCGAAGHDGAATDNYVIQVI